MYPFIAVIWDSRASNAAGAAKRLLAAISFALPAYHPALNEDGCAVFHKPSPDGAFRAYSLHERAGVILGRVFPSPQGEWTSDRSWSPTAAETADIIRSHGSWLVRQMWGSYIAFLLDSLGKNVWVIRDCSGRLPCYQLSHSGADLFFADPAILTALGLVPRRLNWRYMCAFLCSSQLQIRDTALEGVTELLAGDCVHIMPSGRRLHYSIWSPNETIQSPLIHHFAPATRQVRSVTSYCIAAWASAFDTILHSLSGGLDSSVVLACLTGCRAHSSVICVNKYGAHVTEDERAFARVAASKAGVQLLEIPIVSDYQRIDDSLTRMPLSTKPTVSGTIGALELLSLNSISAQFTANTIWTGQGGDHLFMKTSLPVGVVDYVALRGYRLGLLKSLHDAVHISRWNYCRTMSLVWKRNTRLEAHALKSYFIDAHPFITADVRSLVTPDTLLHPWMTDTESLPLGQRLQIAALGEVLNRHRPLPGLEAAHQHHPLLSQPLIELCLRIPSYVHFHGGVDRAVERAAFADLLPNEIFTRRQKGQSTFSIVGLLNRSKQYVRGLLLGGVLVEQGILDPVALEPLLNGQRPTDATNLWPLFSAIAAELWIQSWHNCRETEPAFDFARSASSS